jgi:hypothetical protein
LCFPGGLMQHSVEKNCQVVWPQLPVPQLRV